MLEVLYETGATVNLRYEAGEILYQRGDEAGSLYVVTEGLIRLSVPYQGNVGIRDSTLGLLGPWDISGHPIFVDGRFRKATAEAITDCEVVKVPRVLVKRVIRQHPEIALGMATLLELMLVEYEELVGCLLTRRTDARLANLFPILARKVGKRTESGYLGLSRRFSRRELAAMVASTRESVTAAMIELRERGAIAEEKKGGIILLDPNELEEISRW